MQEKKTRMCRQNFLFIPPFGMKRSYDQAKHKHAVILRSGADASMTNCQIRQRLNLQVYNRRYFEFLLGKREEPSGERRLETAHEEKRGNTLKGSFFWRDATANHFPRGITPIKFMQWICWVVYINGEKQVAVKNKISFRKARVTPSFSLVFFSFFWLAPPKKTHTHNTILGTK